MQSVQWTPDLLPAKTGAGGRTDMFAGLPACEPAKQAADEQHASCGCGVWSAGRAGVKGVGKTLGVAGRKAGHAAKEAGASTKAMGKAVLAGAKKAMAAARKAAQAAHPAGSRPMPGKYTECRCMLCAAR